MKGRIIKNQNGYFSIWGEAGQLHLCRSRGRLKRSTDVLVGDLVEYEVPEAATEAVITAVYPRKTALRRPTAVNVDLLVLTSAVRTPDVNRYTLDKMILLAEDAGLSILLCFNKADLAPELADRLSRDYEQAGYRTVRTSTVTGAGLEELDAALKGHIIAFSGPSGVGKSSLLNHFLGEERLASGGVSTRTGRGKNTTRHAELIPFGPDGFLMDTPGYTSLALENIPPENVSYLFRDFRPYLSGCRFTDCMHLREPDCAVRAAVERGEILRSRYQSYCQALDELKENRSRYL